MSRTVGAMQYAVVTGSSSGIGKEIALALARNGTNLFIHGGHNALSLKQTKDELEQYNIDVQAALIDISTEVGQQALYTQAVASGNIPDIWINNAGADILTGDAAGFEYDAKLDLLWRVDVLATVRLSKSIGREMVKQRRGVILNMSWDQAETGMEGDSGELFGITKGAVTAFTRSLAKTLAPHVRVNAIAAGWIKTKWGISASSDWQHRAKSESLLNRWGSTEDIASAAMFLTSNQAEFITGQIMSVNGGRKSP